MRIKDISKLKEISYFIKKLSKFLIKKTHHIGSCLSSTDIIVSLFFNIMRFSKKDKKNNDFFILSKGHAALVYYLALMKKNFFSEKYLYRNFLENNGSLGGHPDRNTNLGIDYCSGSLGHGISVGCGVALSYLKDKKRVMFLF